MFFLKTSSKNRLDDDEGYVLPEGLVINFINQVDEAIYSTLE